MANFNDNYNENYSKKIYNPSTGDVEDLQTGYNCVTGNRAVELMKMALIGKIPDSNFSDFEVALWSNFTSVLKNEIN